MGVLVPANFDIEGLEHSEQRVVNALVSLTDDAWLVLPNVMFRNNGSDGEADIVLLHPERGALVIEVKGGRISVQEGMWFQDGRRLAKSPVEQARSGNHALRRRLQEQLTNQQVPSFTYALAFPDAQAKPTGDLGPDLEPNMVLTASELQWPDEALLTATQPHPVLPPDVLQAAIRALRPDVTFTGRIGGQLEALSRRLDEQTETVLKTAEGLDSARRVWVTGPAGSGKTGLALRWARRAEARGERVLLLCFNRPMGDLFERTFEDHPLVTAGTFHSVSRRLLESTGMVWPEHPDQSFWNEAVPEALVDAAVQLEARFDTIIIDEVQDIQPHWFVAIEGLLDPAGANRLYRLGDQAQNVYRVPEEQSGDSFLFELNSNCRNTKSIATVAGRVGAASALPNSPDGPPVRFTRVGGLKELRRKVGQELHHLVVEQRLPPSSVAVITTRADLRDAILDANIKSATLARWDQRSEGVVVCETAHRLKGTEWQAVIVASLEPTTTAWLRDVLYVALTRACTWLSIVAPDDTCELLGGG